MIIHISKDISKEALSQLTDKYKAQTFSQNGHYVLVTSSSVKEIDPDLKKDAVEFYVFNDDIQLASRKYKEKTRTITIGDLQIGGSTNNTLMITGPCSVESREQIFKTAEFLKEQGVKVLRAGAFKPRTSPYSFQGLGLAGLKLLDEVRKEFGFKIITEVKDASHVDHVIEYADIVQIGAKAMYDHGILRKCAEIKKPVLLKRGFGSTLQEFVQGAEFILSGGNENVILCERGIRTFETKTRFTLDLCGVAYLKHHTNLPVVVDPSHAMGYSYGVADLARAATAMGVDGLLIETHPDPKSAKSDAAQQLNFKEFSELHKSLIPVAKAVGRQLI